MCVMLFGDHRKRKEKWRQLFARPRCWLIGAEKSKRYNIKVKSICVMVFRITQSRQNIILLKCIIKIILININNIRITSFSCSCRSRSNAIIVCSQYRLEWWHGMAKKWNEKKGYPNKKKQVLHVDRLTDIDNDVDKK